MNLRSAAARAFAPALLLALSSQLQAQPIGTIRGRVTDASTGRGVPEAQVTVASTRIGAMSGASGEFVLTLAATAFTGGTARTILAANAPAPTNSRAIVLSDR
jgi:Carboxypeptidase regulatory-like domain